MATITAAQKPTTLVLKDRSLNLPANAHIRGTSFGNYEFKATETYDASAPPFYGILPLALKGGHMATDIIFFAPALFFNLRGAFKFYEVDVRSHTIRYRDDERDPWNSYQVKPEEEARARAYFEGRQQTSGTTASP
ncbi:hypothetical protein GCM10025793_15910 [Lysobacter lycopersici]